MGEAVCTGDQYRTYKFGYTVDNPSYEYLRHKIFNEDGSPSIEETFYTLNLRNAKLYFYEQLKELYSEAGISGLQEIYKKLTKKFLFNEYVIKDEFDVFVAFETMNNRGKRLSDLELLKNRLIYLTTLYTDEELDAAERKSLRDAINGTWKEVYYQLGRNDKRPLNDDDFLKAHWIMYFQYSRKKGNDYIKFLLDEQFSPQKIHKKIEREVALEMPEEQLTDFEIDDTDSDNGTAGDATNSEADFISFVNANTKAGAVGKVYMRAIRELEELIKEPIFNSYSLDQLTARKIAELMSLESADAYKKQFLKWLSEMRGLYVPSPMLIGDGYNVSYDDQQISFIINDEVVAKWIFWLCNGIFDEYHRIVL